MHLNHSNPSELVKNVFICSLSILLLFWGFYSNCWQVANQQWFVKWQRGSESLNFIGRMVKSRQNGIFSDGGLTGFGSPNATPVSYSDRVGSFQYQAYINNLRFNAYSPYLSQIGGQGILFSLLDRLIPLSPQVKLQFFHMFTSLLSALALASITLWFSLEFGFCIAMFVLPSMVLSQWLTVFGRNLWWSIWGFYLPMIVVTYFLKYDRMSTNHHSIKFGFLVFISVFAKCLVNGYEYITTTLIMMMVPFVYYSILYKLSFRRFIRCTLVAMFGSCLAIFLSFSILCFQIASVKGNLLDGVNRIDYSLQKRTHGGSPDFPIEIRSSLQSNTTNVVFTYLKGTFFDLNNYLSTESSFVKSFLFKIRYIHLIVIFLVASVLVYRRRNKYSCTNNALVFATCFSITSSFIMVCYL